MKKDQFSVNLRLINTSKIHNIKLTAESARKAGKIAKDSFARNWHVDVRKLEVVNIDKIQ